MYRSSRYLLISCVILSSLVACTSAVNNEKNPLVEARSQAQTRHEKIADLLQSAQKSPADQADRYLLEAAQLLIESKQAREAEKVLLKINYVTLTPSLKQAFLLSYARACMLLDRPDKAIHVLSGNPFDLNALPSDLSLKESLALDHLRAEAYEASGNHLAAAKERIFFNALLSPQGMAINNEKIWADLQNSPQNELEKLAFQNDRPELRGWAQLALIPQSYEHDIDAQFEALLQWQKLWPNHPASKHLPNDLTLISRLQTARPKHIALLLPFSGPLAGPATAIRDGFLSSFYLSRSRKHAPPQISIYDSETPGKTFIQRYLEISQSGADLIIGPLKKEDVSALQELESLSIPTLSLNYGTPNSKQNHANLFQFGLSPEDESKQIALKAKDHGYQKAVLLYPDNDWGHRMSQSFTEQWRQMGGILLSQQAFPVKGEYSASLKSLLNIPESEMRAQRIRSILNEAVETSPYKRNDIDFIVMFAQPNQAKQITPGLAFFDALDIPIYSSSDVYDFTQTNSAFHKDLNGIRFCDIPWILKTRTESRQKIHAAWPTRNSPYERLYALGADAFYLSPRLAVLKSAPESLVSGHTGTLRLLPNGRLERFPSWAKFEDGASVLIGDPVFTQNPL